MRGPFSLQSGRERAVTEPDYGAGPFPRMHPVIKVVSFLIVALFLTRAQLHGIAVGLLMVLFFWLWGSRFELSPLWRMLRRMRWLFISILITYLWFTPGTPLLPFLESFSPTREGVVDGGLRVAALMLIVAQVGVLLQTTSREELVTAIRWLAAPLRLFGFDRDRLALRLVLILESVEEIQLLLSLKMAEFSNGEKKGVSRIAHAVAELFRAVVDRAETTPLRSVRLVDRERPPPYQWVFPVMLILLFGGVPHIDF